MKLGLKNLGLDGIRTHDGHDLNFIIASAVYKCDDHSYHRIFLSTVQIHDINQSINNKKIENMYRVSIEL